MPVIFGVPADRPGRPGSALAQVGANNGRKSLVITEYTEGRPQAWRAVLVARRPALGCPGRRRLQAAMPRQGVSRSPLCRPRRRDATLGRLVPLGRGPVPAAARGTRRTRADPPARRALHRCARSGREPVPATAVPATLRRHGASGLSPRPAVVADAQHRGELLHFLRGRPRCAAQPVAHGGRGDVRVLRDSTGSELAELEISRKVSAEGVRVVHGPQRAGSPYGRQGSMSSAL